MALTKVSGGILDPGINVAGIVTATGFDGPFTGGSGSNINAGIITATGFDLNGNGDISGNLVIGGNLTANGDFTTLNTTLREVEILRVDAAASVAAGIITQTGSGHGLVLADDTTLKMAMNVGSGIATFRALNAGYSNHNGASGIFQQVDLNTASVTFGNQISVNGATITTGNGSHRIRSAANDFAIESTTSSYKGFRFLGNVPENTLVVSNLNSGSVGIGSEIPTQKLDVVGTVKAISLDISGDIDVDGHTELDNVNIAGVTTFINNVKFDGATAGRDVTFIRSSNTFEFATNAILELGNGGSGDCRLFNNGTDTRIINGDGTLKFESDTHEFKDKDNTTSYLNITSAGHLGVGDDSPDTRLSVKAASGTDVVGKFTSTDANAWIQFRDNTTTDTAVMVGANGNNLLFRAGSNTRWKIDSSGHFVPNSPGSFNIGSTSLEIGDIYLGVNKRVYCGINQELELYTDGTNGYLKETNGDLYLQSTADDVIIRAADNISIQAQGGEYCIDGNGNGSVNLYYDGGTYTTPKLSTTATGITVDGEVAASQDYPNFRPTLDFNFASTKKLDPRITYQRTGSASFVNEFGKVVTVGDNVPRFDHDPITRESKGLLIEESRTNLYTYSSNFSTGWGNTRLTVTVNTTTTPDKTNSASTLTVNSASNYAYSSIYFTTNQGTSYALSGWFKYINCQYVWLLGGEATNLFAYFDIQNGTIGGTNGYECTITAYPDGWYRCTATRTKTGSTGSEQIGFGLTRSNNNPTDNQVGDAVYVWGAQHEVGAFPSSYIPTNGSTETRGYEAVTLEGTDFSDIFGTDFKEFSLVADYDNTQTDDGTNYGIIDLWGESTGYDDRIEWFKDNASPYHIETRAFGQGNALFNNGELSASSKAKSQRFATSWYVPDYSNTSSRRFVVSMGGEAVDIIPDNSGTTVPLLTRMGIGCNPTRLDFKPGLLHFKRLMVYNRTLSDGQLQNLSAQ